MVSRRSNNPRTRVALWAKSPRVRSIFDSAKAIWLVRIGLQAMLVGYQFNAKEAILTAKPVQFCQKPCTPITPIATFSLEQFV